MNEIIKTTNFELRNIVNNSRSYIFIKYLTYSAAIIIYGIKNTLIKNFTKK